MLSNYFGIKRDKNFWGMTFFGHEFTIKRPYNKLQSEIDWIKQYLQAEKDPRDFPPAIGLLRDLQLARIKLLKHIDELFTKNGLGYWIDCGTLLGAVRHGGFIPWDDDVDISLVRSDHDKVIELVNSNSENYVAFFSSYSRNASRIISIQHKAIPMVEMDVYAYDRYPRALSFKEQKDLSDTIRKHRNALCKRWGIKKWSQQRIHEHFTYYWESLISEENAAKHDCENGTLVYAAEVGTSLTTRCINYEYVFPLKRISFDGLSVPCPCNPEIYLHNFYHDYLRMPLGVLRLKNVVDSMDIGEISALKKFVQEG